MELDPRRKDVDLWDEDGRLTGNIVRSLTKREYQDQYLSLMGVTLPPPMDDPLVKKLSELYRGKQSHNLMFAQSVGWHDDDIYDQQRMCVVIPILTHGHHVLDVECNTVRLERGKIYLFNQRRQHQLRYDGKDPNLEGISRPCALLSVSFEKFRGYK